MQGYNKGSVVTSITVHYDGYGEASMQGNINGSEGPFITVQYNG
jgi:hypothetical protein